MVVSKLVRCLSRINSITLKNSQSVYNSYRCNTSHFTLFMVRSLLISGLKSPFRGSRLCFSSDTNPQTPSKKKKYTPKITLIGVDESLTVTSLEDASKIAKRRDLKLVKIVDIDTKSQRPVYRLMTGAQYFEEELKQRKLKSEKRKTELKGEKLLSMSCKINEHDFQAKLNKLKKWLEKYYEARLIISADSNDTSHAEKMLERIKDYVKDQGKVVQVRKKDREVKFIILPLKKEDSKPAE